MSWYGYNPVSRMWETHNANGVGVTSGCRNPQAPNQEEEDRKRREEEARKRREEEQRRRLRR